jgi:hypothetical protein
MANLESNETVNGDLRAQPGQLIYFPTKLVA